MTKRKYGSRRVSHIIPDETPEIVRLISSGTHVAKLNGSRLAEFRDREIGRLRLNEELAQGHLLAPEHAPHV